MFVSKTPAENSRHLGDCIISKQKEMIMPQSRTKQGKPSALHPQRTICLKVGKKPDRYGEQRECHTTKMRLEKQAVIRLWRAWQVRVRGIDVILSTVKT